jgi:hypothetical protein
MYSTRRSERNKDENKYENKYKDEDEDEELEELLNLNWLKELRKEEENYDEFYNGDVNEISIYFFFTNNNVLRKIRKRKYILNEINELKSEEIIQIIKSEKDSEKKINKLDMLLKYNLDIGPFDLIKCIENEELYEEYSKRSFTRVKTIMDIRYNPTIEILKDLNALYVIYKEIDVGSDYGNDMSNEKRRTNNTTKNTTNNTTKNTIKNTSKKIVFNTNYTRKNRSINFVKNS